MSAAEVKNGENHYIDINGTKVYADYINSRLKILDYNSVSQDTVMSIIDFAQKQSFGKIIYNSRIKLLCPFINCGFKVEGTINGFFEGEDAYCISYFIDKKRENTNFKELEDTILYKCVVEKKKTSVLKKTTYLIRKAEISDIGQIIDLFKAVFQTYPSPVYSHEYLEHVMDKQILFKVAVDDGKIISIASADMDKLNLNAEITDCATYPEYRGKGILTNLICSLEKGLKDRSFITLYSLSRAINPGINMALSKLDYKYCGRLINNCHICGNFEDMNIWVKKLNKK
ncbi:MAG: putative beta-lysine N-acetyltransferase [Flavobacterium sp.]|nr:putative beta-lysine N-acetyltransferase [Flavobacterium sp.]